MKKKKKTLLYKNRTPSLTEIKNITSYTDVTVLNNE